MTPRRSALALVALLGSGTLGGAGTGVASVAAAAEPKSSTPQVSSNGRFSVRAVEPAPGQCRLEVSQESEVSWELPTCMGNSDDLYFVSNDGERVWVLRTLPEVPPAPRKKRIRESDLVGRAPVAFLINRAGQVVETRKLAAFLNGPGRRRIQILGRHFKWLEGVTGLPGRVPRTNTRNQVEFEVVGPRTVHLDF